MILDGGAVAVGLESTIVDLTGSVPALLRPGAITPEMLEGVLGKIEFDPVLTKPLTPDMHPKAPGMKYRHYAPRAEMFLVDGTQAAVIRKINACAAVAKADGKKVGILASAETQMPTVPMRSSASENAQSRRRLPTISLPHSARWMPARSM